MTPHPIVHHDLTGQTVVAKLYNLANALAGSITLTEAPASSGRYVASVADVVALSLPSSLANYDVRVETNGLLSGVCSLRWDGTAEVGVEVGSIGGDAVSGLSLVTNDALQVVTIT